MGQLIHVLKLCVPVAALVLLSGGCQSNGDNCGRGAHEFAKADDVSSVDRFANQQIASGVRTDGTLRPYHFDNAALNSLGREKIDHLLSDDDQDGELVVYVDVPRGEGDADQRLADARHDAVAKYLMSLGVAEDRFRLESGHNPHNTTSAVLAKPSEGDPNAEVKAYGEGVGNGFGKAMSDSMKK